MQKGKYENFSQNACYDGSVNFSDSFVKIAIFKLLLLVFFCMIQKSRNYYISGGYYNESLIKLRGLNLEQKS